MIHRGRAEAGPYPRTGYMNVGRAVVIKNLVCSSLLDWGMLYCI
jgi:hypothetical protein